MPELQMGLSLATEKLVEGEMRLRSQVKQRVHWYLLLILTHPSCSKIVKVTF